MIARRLRRGRQHKAEAGGYAHGSPRHGWKAHEGDLVLEDAEQAVLSQMRPGGWKGRASGRLRLL